MLAEAPYLIAALPELPRLLHQRLLAAPVPPEAALRELASARRERNLLLGVVAVLLAAMIVLVLRPL
jgi:hypothetical protein